jgi:hypothetical protein
MADRTDVLMSNLEELQQDLLDVWHTLTRDPAKEARKERAWTILAGVFTAVSAIMARRAAAKVWGILTGEAAPTAKRPAPPARGGPSDRRTTAQPDGETEPERAPTAAGA